MCVRGVGVGMRGSKNGHHRDSVCLHEIGLCVGFVM